MKTPSRHRNALARQFGSTPEGVDLNEVATKAHYVGSPEHKDAPSFAGKPKPRLADASICDPSFAGRLDDINCWLRDAIRAGQFSAFWDHNQYPRYVWHRENDTVFEARLINSGNGAYKGYALYRNEWPKEFQ